MVMEASQDEKAKFNVTRRSRSESEAGSEATTSDSKPAAVKKRKKSTSEDSSSGSTLQERWDEMFERLRRYKDTKGNCNVPNRYAQL